MKIIIAWLGILMSLVSLGGCCWYLNCYSTDRHEVFLQRSGRLIVGKDIYSGTGPSISSFTEKSLEYDTYGATGGEFTGFKKLPNGNWELETGLPHEACKIYYEYDHVRKVVLSWRYQGECWQNDN